MVEQEKSIHCVTAVWGKDYTNIFLELSLPSQLSGGNIPFAAELRTITYYIYTTSDDANRIRRHHSFQRLSTYLKVEFLCFDDIIKSCKFSSLMYFHNLAISTASKEKAALLFLAPDFILANGLMSHIIDISNTGKRVIFMLTPRVVYSHARTQLLNHVTQDTNSIAISPNELAKLSLQYLHPIERTYFYGPELSSFPIHSYWKSGPDNIIAHCFYLHPIFVDPLFPNALPALTVDADYIDRCCPDCNYIHVVRDSDECMCIELSGDEAVDANASKPRWNANIASYAIWASVNANPVYDSTLHHWLFRQQIFIHSEKDETIDIDQSRIANQTAKKILLLVNLLRIARAAKALALHIPLSLLKYIRNTVRQFYPRKRGIKFISSPTLGDCTFNRRVPRDPSKQHRITATSVVTNQCKPQMNFVKNIQFASDRLRTFLWMARKPRACIAAGCVAVAERHRANGKMHLAEPLYILAIISADLAQFIPIVEHSSLQLIAHWTKERIMSEATIWADRTIKYDHSIGAYYFYSLLLAQCGAISQGVKALLDKSETIEGELEQACWKNAVIRLYSFCGILHECPISAGTVHTILSRHEIIF